MFFLKTSVKYLDHIISNEGVQADPEKISAVKNWCLPKTNEDLSSFLGFCNYYC